MFRNNQSFWQINRAGRSQWGLVVLLAIILAGLLVSRFDFFGRKAEPLHDPSAEPRAVTPRGDLVTDEQARIQLVKNAALSVVSITTTTLRRDTFTLNVQEMPEGSGSGIVWDDQGHIVTNFHVIQNARAAQVTLPDQTSYSARYVGGAPDKDLAVLKIDAPKEKLRPIPVGTSNDLQVGQSVLAIGNPFGLDATVTTGIISALGREIKSVSGQPITGVIQTDTAINPGNSGGPLLDSAGRLIGVNTAIVSPSGAYAGIGFAIPVDTVNQVVPQLIKTGKAERAGMGVKIAEPQVARRLGVTSGVLIIDVVPGGAAAKAGLRPTTRDSEGNITLGDVIVGIDGVAVTRDKDLFTALGNRQVGDRVKVTVLREGERREVELTLQAIRAG